ncbi:spermatogenesis-associated protein 17 [Lingula anatina]|uniref:Spermatogenesis-associated protein 17 n=1 Tax=Lingula anatina TaxID=7574 RepID=A0A1S3JVA1_LINAN|nr:spermatogenesis-associated protein 17 [Lingula anatina]|eukprot:XP_013414283.1 spermatogenesis-associated protein 17 [Lingula anatina]
MATMIKLMERVDPILQDCYDNNNKAEEERQKEFQSIIKIQAWYRGQKARAYLRYLNDCAIVIQKRWRGFLGRKHYRVYVKNKVFIMKMNHYNEMAVKIQKIWRAYYTRKYIFNYYSRKRYLEGLQTKNQVIRQELSEYAEQQAIERMKHSEEEVRRRLQEWASKNHYLRSTEVMPGIYNSPFYPFPEEREYILQNARPRSHKKVVPKQEPFDPTCKSYTHLGPKPLPPIGEKPQGPFRDPGEVQKQRYKPFQPSLRVATDFTSLEKAREKMKQDEWIGRINDNLFVPFSKRHRPYESLLHTTSQYGHLPYGTKYFVEEQVDKHISKQPMKTLVPPIPIFEKLNDTYSQGQV